MAMVRAVLYEYESGYAVVVESMYSCILTVQQLQKLQNY